MASRSATVLIIFMIAIVAFCLASVCGAMTGTISILPNGTGNGHTILDNLSAITDDSGDSGKISGYQDKDYSSSSSSNVETTTDNSAQSSDTSNDVKDNNNNKPAQPADSDSGKAQTDSNPSPKVETTTAAG